MLKRAVLVLLSLPKAEMCIRACVLIPQVLWGFVLNMLLPLL